jgi:hypothetical protein
MADATRLSRAARYADRLGDGLRVVPWVTDLAQESESAIASAVACGVDADLAKACCAKWGPGTTRSAASANLFTEGGREIWGQTARMDQILELGPVALWIAEQQVER